MYRFFCQCEYFDDTVSLDFGGMFLDKICMNISCLHKYLDVDSIPFELDRI